MSRYFVVVNNYVTGLIIELSIDQKSWYDQTVVWRDAQNEMNPPYVREITGSLVANTINYVRLTLCSGHFAPGHPGNTTVIGRYKILRTYTDDQGHPQEEIKHDHSNEPEINNIPQDSTVPLPPLPIKPV
jgi:hypothetical protein